MKGLSSKARVTFGLVGLAVSALLMAAPPLPTPMPWEVSAGTFVATDTSLHACVSVLPVSCDVGGIQSAGSSAEDGAAP